MVQLYTNLPILQELNGFLSHDQALFFHFFYAID